jgi:hypothetical protein
MRTPILSHARLTAGRLGLAAGAGVLALAAGVLFGLQATPDDNGLTAYREVEMHVARMPVQTMNELASQSDAVVVGRVVAKGETRFQAIDTSAPRAVTPDPLPADVPKDVADALKHAQASPANDGIARPPRGIPMTPFVVEVSRVLKGTLTRGSTIAVTQPGGDVQIPLGAGRPTLQRRVLAEHDPLMIQGQEQVLFLHHGDDGSYTVTSGPDGRFSLDARRTLQPVDEGSAVGKAHKGKTLDELEVAVRSAR